ncbi:hypothetical protein B0T25DRAFT_58553 [Lasiosphaeria hispida]|uniref:Uncharacterized protein n=1 Tax=Lasiosphaeria hispida TaxID=260671 RepID=A0AAJ0MKR2_9PEZI|nr:hypothetical protein B0T25DRAFT_58553 [Lasiosphaeria hispida]
MSMPTQVGGSNISDATMSMPTQVDGSNISDATMSMPTQVGGSNISDATMSMPTLEVGDGRGPFLARISLGIPQASNPMLPFEPRRTAMAIGRHALNDIYDTHIRRRLIQECAAIDWSHILVVRLGYPGQAPSECPATIVVEVRPYTLDSDGAARILRSVGEWIYVLPQLHDVAVEVVGIAPSVAVEVKAGVASMPALEVGGRGHFLARISLGIPQASKPVGTFVLKRIAMAIGQHALVDIFDTHIRGRLIQECAAIDWSHISVVRLGYPGQAPSECPATIVVAVWPNTLDLDGAARILRSVGEWIYVLPQLHDVAIEVVQAGVAPGVAPGAVEVKAGAPGVAPGAVEVKAGAPGAVEVKAGAPGVAPGAVEVKAGALGVAPGAVEVKAGAPGVVPSAVEVKAGALGVAPGAVEVKAGAPGVAPGAVEVKAGAPGAVEVKAGAPGVAPGAVEVKAGAPGAVEVKAGAPSVAPGAVEVKAGAPGAVEVKAGAPGVAPGAVEVKAGAPGVAPGAVEVKAGAPGVAPGAVEVKAGAPGVAPGAVEVKAGAPGVAPGAAVKVKASVASFTPHPDQLTVGTDGKMPWLGYSFEDAFRNVPALGAGLGPQDSAAAGTLGGYLSISTADTVEYMALTCHHVLSGGPASLPLSNTRIVNSPPSQDVPF